MSKILNNKIKDPKLLQFQAKYNINETKNTKNTDKSKI